MYFHLIWIKESNWVQNDLDLLIQWWDGSFVRKFLWYRWVVIVSINEFKEDPQNFWNIMISILYENTEIQILTNWENLQDVAYLYISLWLSPHFVNFIKDPVPDWEVQEIIQSALDRIREESERTKREQEKASDFIASMVKKYPGKVKIISIGIPLHHHWAIYTLSSGNTSRLNVSLLYL